MPNMLLLDERKRRRREICRQHFLISSPTACQDDPFLLLLLLLPLFMYLVPLFVQHSFPPASKHTAHPYRMRCWELSLQSIQGFTFFIHYPFMVMVKWFHWWEKGVILTHWLQHLLVLHTHTHTLAHRKCIRCNFFLLFWPWAIRDLDDELLSGMNEKNTEFLPALPTTVFQLFQEVCSCCFKRYNFIHIVIPSGRNDKKEECKSAIAPSWANMEFWFGKRTYMYKTHTQCIYRVHSIQGTLHTGCTCWCGCILGILARKRYVWSIEFAWDSALP